MCKLRGQPCPLWAGRQPEGAFELPTAVGTALRLWWRAHFGAVGYGELLVFRRGLRPPGSKNGASPPLQIPTTSQALPCVRALIVITSHTRLHALIRLHSPGSLTQSSTSATAHRRGDMRAHYTPSSRRAWGLSKPVAGPHTCGGKACTEAAPAAANAPPPGCLPRGRVRLSPLSAARQAVPGGGVASAACLSRAPRV